MKGPKIAIAAALLVTGTSGAFAQGGKLGAKATFQMFRGTTGVPGVVSPNGKHFNVHDNTRQWISFNGGKFVQLPAIPDSTRTFVSAITNDGTVYGGYQANRRNYSFRWKRGGPIDKHWPHVNGVEDLVVRGISSDGRVMVGAIDRGGEKREALVWSGGRATRLFAPTGSSVGVQFVSDDGKTLLGSYMAQPAGQPFPRRAGILWRKQPDGYWRSETLATLADIQSANGRFRLEIGQSDVFLSGGKRAVKIRSLRFKPGGKNETRQIKAVTLPVKERMVARHLANDGKLVIATSQFGPKIVSHSLVWTPETSWKPLQWEIERRGAKIPAGWKLVYVTGVSVDGKTVVGIANNGSGSAPFVARFS